MKQMSDKDYIATLRSHGLQVTYQRLAIYQVLYNTKAHPSAEVIYKQVKKRFPMISLGTVYKTLERFFSVGLIQKVSPLTDVARYDAAVDPHHHFVCLKCQEVMDLDMPPSTGHDSAAVPDGYKVLYRQVVLQGFCPKCQNQNGNGS